MNTLMCSILFMIILSCAGSVEEKKVAGYHLDAPARVIVLEAELSEISGLSYTQGHFYAVQDERGRVYKINAQSGELVDHDKFWDKGDFEGIECFDSGCVAMKSNGNLYYFDPGNADEDSTERLKLDFPKGSNFEGLGYDPASGKLLLTAKRSPKDTEKEVYSVAWPRGDATVQNIHTFDQGKVYEKMAGRQKKGFARFKQNVAATTYSFNPSAIAVHPETGDYFVLSSPVPQLLVCSPNWQIKEVVFLDNIMCRQPEAICFDDNGALYIANEGGGAKGNILKFERK